ncbi:MAG: PP0621 family protein [Paraburkholderia sp.]|uniref:PP0621 family protein n=1 Tax=Paraburkholderia sp. TaxID=1926495 RepID=UPI003C5F606B
MRQIFLLILLFVVGQWLVKALRRADANHSQRTGAAGSPGAGQGAGQSAGAQRGASQAPRLAEPMIRCVECGVHAPASDSVVVAGQPFCCAAHAQRHATPPSGRDAR